MRSELVEESGTKSKQTTDWQCCCSAAPYKKLAPLVKLTNG